MDQNRVMETMSRKLLEACENTEKIFFAGKQEEYDAFWDAKQPSKGAPTTMNGDFGGHWTVETFNPKYDIVPISCPNLFFGNYLKIDLVEHFNNIGRKLDFSQCDNQNSAFYLSNFTHIGNVSALGGYYNVFTDCKYLVTIDEWGDAQGGEMTGAGMTSTFSGCTALENITIKGYFANDIYFKDCTKLSKGSITNIINHLSDTATGKTLTLSQVAVDREFEGVSGADFTTVVEGSVSAEWLGFVSTKPDWTITLV